MAVIKKWSGDGLSPGTVTTSTAGTGDSPFNGFNGDPGGTYPTVVASGPRSPQLEFPTANSKSAAPYWDLPTLTKSAGRFYFTTPSAWNSVSHAIAQMATGGTLCARINISGTGAPGQLRITNAAATQVAATASNTIALSTRYRVEWTLDQVAGVFTVNMYLGDSTTVFTTLSATSSYGASCNRVVFGNYSAAAVPLMQFDDFAIADTATLIGPAVVTPPATATIKLWNGTAEVAVTAKLWNGTAEVPLTI